VYPVEYLADQTMAARNAAGLYKSNPVDTHSLKAAWFQPARADQVKTRCQAFAFKCNLHR
jgi:hypothetical protein